GALVAAAVVAAGVYAFRARHIQLPVPTNGAAAQQTSSAIASSSEQPAAAASTGTPRGPVSIDPRRQPLLGVGIVPVRLAPVQQTLRTVGVIGYDETRQADVNVRVEGWIRDLYVDYTGQPIQKGQPLFTLYSPDLLTTQQEYLLALKTRDQVQGSVIPDARERADQLVAAARQRLALWDLPIEEIRALDENRQPLDVVTFRSPASGFVIE